MLLYSKLSCFILLCVLFNEICDGRARIKLLQAEHKITPNIRYGLSDESKHVGTGMLSEEKVSDVSKPHEMVTPHAVLNESTSSTTGNSSAITKVLVTPPAVLNESTSSTTGNSSAISKVLKPADRPAIVGYGYKVESDISSAAIASLAGG